MTVRIVRALVWKEALRYWHNRPSLVLAVLLVMVSLLVSAGADRGILGPGEQPAICHVLYWGEGDPFIDDLQAHRPPGRDVRIAPASSYVNDDGVIEYPGDDPRTACVSIQIRPGKWSPRTTDGFAPVAAPADTPLYKVWYWYPKGRAEALLPFKNWFNARLRAFHGNAPAIVEADTTMRSAAGPVLPLHRVLIGLVAAAVYLICFHLHVLVTSEERERRTLLAQMLTPLTVKDLLVAKVCFHVPVTLGLAAIILAANCPAALTRPTFWIAMVAGCIGYLSIGLVICSVTRSQSAAGLTALSYLMLVGVAIYLGATIPLFALLRTCLLDYHLIQLIHASLMDAPPWWAAWQTLGLVALTAAWAIVAVNLFARQKWR